MKKAKFNVPGNGSSQPHSPGDPAAYDVRQNPSASNSYDIIKLLDLEDENVEISGPEVKKDRKILTISKRLEPTWCPVCGSRMHSKGIYTRTVNHPVLQGGLPLMLKVRQRSWKCTNDACGHFCSDRFSFVDPGRRMTNVSDLAVVMGFKDMKLTARQIAERYNVSDTYAAELFTRYVDMPRRQMSEAISIDEVDVSIAKDCKYALVIQDFTTGEPIDMIPSRRQEVTEPYFAAIPAAERNRVKYLISDMYRPYINCVDKYFPNAVSVVDSFHVVKMINGRVNSYINQLIRHWRKLDEQRHEELEQRLGRRIKQLPHSKEYYLLVNFKWLILKNHDDISYSSQPRYNYKLKRYVTLGELEEMLFDIDPNLREIRNLKERYIRFNRDYGNRHKAASQELRKLIQLYRESDYRMFQDIADTLEYHFDSITNSFIMVERLCSGKDHVSRLSNGPMEGLNRMVKDLKRNGHGYRNFEHIRNRFLFARRQNAHIRGIPKSREEVRLKTGITRGAYKKGSDPDGGESNGGDRNDWCRETDR